MTQSDTFAQSCRKASRPDSRLARRLLWFGVALFTLCAVPWPVFGQCEFQMLLASGGGAGDRFGRSMSLNDGVLVIGAWADAGGGTDAGAAYVYRVVDGTWIQEQKLVASSGMQGDQFGWACASEGDLVLVSSHLDDERGLDAGAVYVFRHDGVSWNQEAKLTALDAQPGDRFGQSLAIDAGHLVIGSPQDDDQGSNSGSAYLFTHDESSGWNI